MESLLVGGNAVNLLAYSRTTFDVDLLVPELDVERWISFLGQHGYTIFQRTANFVRLRFASNPAAALPIDLMLADQETFRKMRTGSQPFDPGNDLHLTIPSPLHLIARKLHALRNPARLESGIDLQDVKLDQDRRNRCLQQRIQEIAKRYATKNVLTRLLTELGREPGP